MTNNITKQDLILYKKILSDLEKSFFSYDDVKKIIPYCLLSEEGRILLDERFVNLYLGNDFIRLQIAVLHKIIGKNNDI